METKCYVFPMSKTRKSPVRLVGQLEGYELSKSGKVRSLSLLACEDLKQIKLTESSRLDLLQGTLNGLISQGIWLEVIGRQKVYPDGTLKNLKAQQLRVLQDPPDSKKPAIDPSKPLSKPSAVSSKILICQKSSCRKRGSLAVQHALEQELDDRQLSDQISVKATGCLKHCSKGPNLIINKTPHRNVTVKDLNKLLDQYFAPAPAVMV
jgi:Thioredoxin-like [2Fe-2S] ferredoxin